MNVIIGYFIYNGINSSISNNNLIFTVFMVFINIVLTAIIVDIRNKKQRKRKSTKN